MFWSKSDETFEKSGLLWKTSKNSHKTHASEHKKTADKPRHRGDLYQKWSTSQTGRSQTRDHGLWHVSRTSWWGSFKRFTSCKYLATKWRLTHRLMWCVSLFSFVTLIGPLFADPNASPSRTSRTGSGGGAPPPTGRGQPGGYGRRIGRVVNMADCNIPGGGWAR